MWNIWGMDMFYYLRFNNEHIVKQKNNTNTILLMNNSKTITMKNKAKKRFYPSLKLNSG